MTHNTRERIEEIIEAVPRRVKVDPLWDSWLRQSIHQQLQKARHDWLREEIVKLEGMDAHQPNRGIYRNDFLQTIIDRYQSELDQDNK